MLFIVLFYILNNLFLYQFDYGKFLKSSGAICFLIKFHPHNQATIAAIFFIHVVASE